MTEDDSKVEAWLKTAEPTAVRERLHARIMSELDAPHPKQKGVDWRITGSLAAAACLALGVCVWWIGSPAPSPAPVVVVSTTDDDPVLDLPPTAWGYQVALSNSEAEFDRLLDIHGERYRLKPIPVTMASLLD